MTPSLPAARIPSIYQDAEHYDSLAQLTAPADLPLYLDQVERHGGPVLELGCGTGRICLPIAATGLECVGIDNAPVLIAKARAKAAIAGIDVTLVEEDVRAFSLGQTFGLVIFPYNAVNHLLDLTSLVACLSSVRRHMSSASRFIVDTFNPEPQQLGSDPEHETLILDYHDVHRGKRVVMTERNAYDPARQVNRVTWEYQIGNEPRARVDVIDLRVFFPQELDALLELNGFTIERKLGDYVGRPFRSRSAKQIYVCRLSDPPAAPKR